MKIRIGNDFVFNWAIERGGLPEDLSSVLEAKLTASVFGEKQDIPFTVSGNIITIEFTPEICNIIGSYNLLFTYILPDTGLSDEERKCAVDIDAFQIVAKTAQADDSSEFSVTSDMAIAFKGDKGDSAYQVWLEEGNTGTEADYFAFLQKPATDAIGSIQAVEQTVSEDESLRIVSETSRKDAEDLRLSAEILRKENETERGSKESIRNENEVTRGSNENTRNENEATRVENESLRIAAETLRLDAELLRKSGEIERVEAEDLRQTNTSTAIQGANEAASLANQKANLANEKADLANTAAQNANEAADSALTATQEATTAASLADTARLSIQDDLALKANQTDLAQLAGEVSELELKDVVQSDKIKNIENVISTMNPNQSAQLSVTGTSPLSLPKSAANSGMSVKLEGLTEDVGGVITHFEPTGRVRSVDKNGLNPTALYLTAPALRSNGTVKDEIRKGVNGYELVKRVGVGTLGAELITNAADREFSSSDGWSLGGTSEISGGTLKINFSTNAQEASKIFSSIVDLTDSRYFLVSFDLISLNHPTRLRFRAGTSSKTYTIPTTKVGQRVYILFLGWRTFDTGWYSSGWAVTAEIDNFSIKEVTFASESKPSTSALWSTDDLQVIGTTAIHCTTATPVITPISYGGVLNSAESGTVYHEPVIADAGVYDTKIDVLLTDYPISAIEEVIKYENGINTYLDASKAVVASDGLSFTHPDLASGDLVLFTYAFDKESTNGNITATFYDSNVVKIDTVTGKAYKITDVITNGVLTRTLTEV